VAIAETVRGPHIGGRRGHQHERLAAWQQTPDGVEVQLEE